MYLNRIKIFGSTFKLVTFVCLIFFTLPELSIAANLDNKSDTLESLSINESSSHSIVFSLSPSNAFNANETVTIDFDEDGGGWNVDGSSDSIIDYSFNDGISRSIVGVDGDCTGHNGSNDVVSSVNDILGLITFSACSNYSSSTNGAIISVQLGTSAGGTNFITNPSTPNTYPITLNGTQGDTGSILIPIINDDQIVINSLVDESVTFNIDDTSIGFGVLTDGNSRYATADTLGTDIETAAHTITVGTNATGGYTVTIQGTSLESGSHSITPIGAIAAAPNPGTEQFGIRLTASGGSGIVSSPYDSSNFAFDSINFPDIVASASGSTASTIYSVYYLANISSATEAGVYTTSLTYVATGSF